MAVLISYCRKKTQSHSYCYIYGIAKQVAVYGLLKLGLEWNVPLYACISDYIIGQVKLYMHYFPNALSNSQWTTCLVIYILFKWLKGSMCSRTEEAFKYVTILVPWYKCGLAF